MYLLQQLFMQFKPLVFKQVPILPWYVLSVILYQDTEVLTQVKYLVFLKALE